MNNLKLTGKMKEIKIEKEDKPVLELSNADGNAYLILARAQSTAKRAGWPLAKINEYLKKAKSGDYDHLLQTTMEYFDVE